MNCPICSNKNFLKYKNDTFICNSCGTWLAHPNRFGGVYILEYYKFRNVLPKLKAILEEMQLDKELEK